MTVTGVSGDDVTVAGVVPTVGDVLPAQDTAVVLTKRVEFNIDFDGDDAAMFAAQSSQRAHIEFTEDDDTAVAAQELTADEAWSWASGQGIANPLTGNEIGKIQASCGSATAAAAFKFAVLRDVTP